MEFEIKGLKYRAAKLSVFDQLKVSRKLLPLLSGLLGEIKVLRQLKTGQVSVEDALKVALPVIAQTLADLSDDDSNAIIHPCLAVVSRETGKSYSAIFTSGQLMFDDIDLMDMLQIVARVVGDSLGNFLPALPDSETDAPAQA